MVGAALEDPSGLFNREPSAQPAYCGPMAADKVERLRLSVKDWFRLLG